MKTIISCILTFFISLSIFAQEKPERLFINSKAPDFKERDLLGNEIVLKDLRKKGPVVLVFYRGNWCPYCNKQLSRFQDSLQFITAKGATLIAITPEAAEGINKTIDKTKASFPIIHDANMKLSNAYKVSFGVDEKTLSRYRSFGNDLLAVNRQKEKAYLPVPAVYIINKDGAVTYRYFEADYRKRVSVKEILQNL